VYQASVLTWVVKSGKRLVVFFKIICHIYCRSFSCPYNYIHFAGFIEDCWPHWLEKKYKLSFPKLPHSDNFVEILSGGNLIVCVWICCNSKHVLDATELCHCSHQVCLQLKFAFIPLLVVYKDCNQVYCSVWLQVMLLLGGFVSSRQPSFVLYRYQNYMYLPNLSHYFDW
jgi:hypothetical protein